MTYKGREITEDQITVEMVKDIILNEFLTPQKCDSLKYKRNTHEHPDRYTLFDYAKVLEAYKKSIHRARSNPTSDLESGIIRIADTFNSSLFTNEVKDRIWRSMPWWYPDGEEPVSVPLKRTAPKLHVNQYSSKQATITKTRQSYQEQLEDIRWTLFRTFVFVVRGQKCEQCGSTHYLNLHHVKYIPGRKAWEYNCNEVRVLCRECHEKVHNIQKSA